MRKIIVADYDKKYEYKGYVIIKRIMNNNLVFYSIYYHKLLKQSARTLKIAKTIIDGWTKENDE